MRLSTVLIFCCFLFVSEAEQLILPSMSPIESAICAGISAGGIIAIINFVVKRKKLQHKRVKESLGFCMFVGSFIFIVAAGYVFS